jgi:superfamily II DNA or RNA helicase
MQLRSYQTKAIEDLRHSFRKEGKKAPVLVMPTASGKTVVFASISKALSNRSKNVLILVHRKELIDQASDKLTLIGVDHGIIASGYDSKENNIQVASVQTLVRRMHLLNYKPDYIIIDEAHHAAAGTWQKIINFYNKSFKIGCTATPERHDGKGLGEYFDDLVLGPDAKKLIADGFLSDYKVYAPPFKIDLQKITTKRGDYAKGELVDAMEKADIIGDAVTHYKKYADGLPAIAFCISIKHAINVRDKFIEAGYKSAVVHGDMKTTERDEAIKGLKNGSVQVLTSVDVISEGTDVPVVTAAILLRPTQSLSLYLQQVGRVLRPYPGKTAIILDHASLTHTFGFVDDKREWDLNPVKKNSRKGQQAQNVQTCKKCFATFKPASVCPVCGYHIPKEERKVIQVEGDLELLNREKEPQTLKNNYKKSFYAEKSFHKNVLNSFNKYARGKTIVFETENNWDTSNKLDTEKDKQVCVGDNVVFYEGMNMQKYGVVVAFIDKGQAIGHKYPFIVPPIEYQDYEYTDPSIKEGMNLGVMSDIKNNKNLYHKIVFPGKSFSPYIFINDKKYKNEKLKLYLKQIRQNDGYHHQGYQLLLLTDRGLEKYETSFKTGSDALPSVNFKQANKVREQIRNIKVDDFLLENFISICRKASFRAGYNADWIYRNVFAKKFTHEMKIKIELRKCKTIEDFEKVAVKHGYKKGWGYHQWKIRNKK